MGDVKKSSDGESEQDEQRRDEVLKRMLETPPKPHKPSTKKAKKQNSPRRKG